MLCLKLRATALSLTSGLVVCSPLRSSIKALLMQAIKALSRSARLSAAAYTPLTLATFDVFYALKDPCLYIYIYIYIYIGSERPGKAPGDVDKDGAMWPQVLRPHTLVA